VPFNKDDYILRVSSATPVQLVVISHELLVAFLSDALANRGAPPVFAENVGKARDALEQLINGLDFTVTLAQELYDLYLYAGGRLGRAFFAYDADAAAEVLAMFETLLAGWKAIEDAPDTRAAEQARGGPQVYAGLTYERGGLSEIVVDDGEGYRA
jgi:flagellin-specific chaperone FliS